MKTWEISITTSKKEEMLEITSQVQKLVKEGSNPKGAVYVFVPHTTAGLVINEGADPDVAADILQALNRMVPAEGHRHLEGNSPAHIKTTLVGNGQYLPLVEGRLWLGRWQSIFLAEFDGPRDRKVRVGLE